MYDPHAHLHIRSGEYDKADDVAENADGTDDESEPVVGNKVDLVQSSLMIRDPRCIVHCSLTPQLPLKMIHCLYETDGPPRNQIISEKIRDALSIAH